MAYQPWHPQHLHHQHQCTDHQVRLLETPETAVTGIKCAVSFHSLPPSFFPLIFQCHWQNNHQTSTSSISEHLKETQYMQRLISYVYKAFLPMDFIRQNCSDKSKVKLDTDLHWVYGCLFQSAAHQGRRSSPGGSDRKVKQDLHQSPTCQIYMDFNHSKEVMSYSMTSIIRKIQPLVLLNLQPIQPYCHTIWRRFLRKIQIGHTHTANSKNQVNSCIHHTMGS